MQKQGEDPQFIPKAITKQVFKEAWEQYNNFLRLIFGVIGISGSDF
jgi:hypothetical protein